MGLLFFYLFLALTVSFLCSIMESVLLSVPQSFVVVEQGKGKKWANRLANFKQNVDKPLSAILSLNTVAHTIGAAGVGAQAVHVFGETYFGVVSAILTLLILVFTEIIPKTLGANNWRRLAPFTSHTIWIMVIISYPLVWLTSLISKLLSSGKGELSTSREEISALAGIGADEGIFTESESKIIQNIMRLKFIKVSEVMTPRVVVTRAREDTLLTDFLKEKDYMKFSRIPVYESGDDQITGYVFRQEVFEKLAEDNRELKLKDLKRDIIVVSNLMTLFSAFEILLEKNEHLALVVDEYGGMDGIVTLEDIIESILGLEIVDEMDTVTDMQLLAMERWQARQKKYNWLIKNEQ
jgi:CBS domain containing-hemolysin-like protein